MHPHDRLGPFFDPLPVLVLLLDRELGVCFANDKAKSVLGLGSTSSWLRHLHPDDRHHVRLGVERSIRSGTLWSRTCRAGQPDAWVHWLQIDVRPFSHPDVPTAVVEFLASEVTGLMLAQRLSEERQARLTLLSNLAQTVAGESSVTVLLDRCRHAFSGLLAVDSLVLFQSRSEAPGLVLEQVGFVPDDTARGVWSQLQRIERRDHPVRTVWDEAFPRVEPIQRLLDSTPPEPTGVPQQAVLLPLLAAGSVVGVLVIAVSEPVDLVGEDLDLLTQASILVGGALHLAQIVRELDEQRQLAEHASQLKSEFLANTSHELRTPLTGILGFLRLVLDGAGDPEGTRRFVELAHRSGERLLLIINDVLDLARIEADRLEISLTTVVLQQVLAEVGIAFRQQMLDAGVRFEIRKPDDPMTFFADRDRTVQVLTNLLSNALKFTPEDGHVELSATADADRVTLTVRDDGVGIEPQELGRIFESFYQVDGSMTRGVGGTGLGLTISRRLAEMMGGGLTLESDGMNRGTTARLWLPRHATSDGQPHR